MLMFGRQPKPLEFPSTLAFDPQSYQGHFGQKLAELQDLVDVHVVQASSHQKDSYDQRTKTRSFHVGDPVWLSIPNRGKLSPRWEGRWRVKSVQSDVNMEISDGERSKLVHVNRLQHRSQPQPTSQQTDMRHVQDTCEWSPPQIEHELLADTQPAPRYPGRDRQPPDRFRS